VSRRRRGLAAAALLTSAVAAPSAHAAYPGANGKLVFFQEEIGGTEPVGLAVSDANGKNQSGDDFGPRCRGEGLDNIPFPCPVDPQWSPDGRRVAFGLGDYLATIQPDGGGLTSLAFDGLTGIRSPTWSPDGGRLAFSAVRTAGSRRDVYVAATDGAGLRAVTFRGGADQPAWSTRDEIAFTRRDNIRVVKPATPGSGARQITSRGGSRPTWSPSGKSLAFVRSVRVSRRSKKRIPVLYRVTALGKKRKRLTKRRAEDPSWTPDGKRILFVRFDDFDLFIHSVGADGRRERIVTGGFEGRRSAVSEPDQQPLRR
jgi:Tol biopolymer transport system component